jgi:invasion protein IalB
VRIGGARALSGFVVALALLAAPAQAQLPAGAQTVSETYQDWQMICTQQQGVKRCVVSQQQSDAKSSQRVLTVELRPEGDKAEGVLALPFGLALDKGVALKIGEADLGSALRFSTCLPQGCIVPLSFDAKTLAAFRKASAVAVNAVGINDQPAALSISLKGFGPALDRAAALAR